MDLRRKPREGAPQLSLDLFKDACEMLYGPGWQSALARELEVSVRTVHRWARGKAVMPTGLDGHLLHKCKGRRLQLYVVIDELAKHEMRCLDFDRSQG
jgi:hypothetical protein